MPELTIPIPPSTEVRQVQALERIGDLLELEAIRAEGGIIRERLDQRREPATGDYRRTLEERAEALKARQWALLRALWPNAYG